MTSDDLQAGGRRRRDRAEGEQRALLASIVDVARAIFRAKAASVFLYDAESDELVFEAVSGEGERSLVGTRMPVRHGRRGLGADDPRAADRQRHDVRFAFLARRGRAYRFRAESLMCAPLLHGDQALGVINVLDRPLRPGFVLEEIDLLGQFAHQAALALVQLQRARRVQRVLAGESDETRRLRVWPRCLRARRRDLRIGARRVARSAREDARGTGRWAVPAMTLSISATPSSCGVCARATRRRGGCSSSATRATSTRLPLVPIGFVSTMRRTSFRRFSRAHTPSREPPRRREDQTLGRPAHQAPVHRPVAVRESRGA